MDARPLGVVLTAIYSAITAVLSVIVALLSFFGAAIVQSSDASWMGLLGFGLIALGVVLAAVAYGLWSRQPWAPRLTFYAYAVSIPFGVAALLSDASAGNILLQLIGIVLAVVIIAYVRRPEVEAYFAPAPGQPPQQGS